MIRETPPSARRERWRADTLAGFLVFLIALPLCLGISMASGFPPFAGVITAIVGGLVVTFFMGSPLTIKGPAAGLIVIGLGAVEEFGRGDAVRGYKVALACVVVSGLVQVLLGVARAGKLGDFFPVSAVHGMLAAIGIIIAAKQLHVMLGVRPVAKGSLGLVAELPHSLANMNPAVGLIGISSALVLFGWPLLKWGWAKKVPAALVVLVLIIPLSMGLDLEHAHHVMTPFFGDVEVGPRFLVQVPSNLARVIAWPDFSALGTGTFWKYVVMFALVGSLESLLSSKAIDSLDPLHRKSQLDRDLIAIGIGNTLAGLLGGLPMISEIVRSSANVQNGARTRWANFFHGAFLLLFISLAPALVHRIPLAALAAMLVYTGCRLASPKEFKKTLAVGREQLLIFVATILATLASDLLIGIAAGILVKFVLHAARGVSVVTLFRPGVVVDRDGDAHVIRVRTAAVFSNWLGLKRHIQGAPPDAPVVVDLSEAVLVDHTVMSHLHALSEERARAGGGLALRGLERHAPASRHPHAARLLRAGGRLSRLA